MKIPAWILNSIKDTRYQGILAAVGVLLVIVLYSSAHRTPENPVAINLSSTTPSALLASGNAATNNASSSTPSTATSSTAQAPKPAGAKASVDTPSTTPAPNVAAEDLTAAGGKLLKSLVNIVCVSSDPSIPSISGSGVIIDSRGIILTAAHVAQLFLLQDYLGPDKVECIVRTGSPARRAYLAEPIYVSPTWVSNNPTTLTTASPQGTGENDFALLAITDTATSTPLPNSFPAVSLAPDDPQQNEKVAIGSYGAQYLTAAQLNYSLYPILVFGSIGSRYTYGTNTVDVVSIIGSAASQEGSSGGGIVDGNGQLQGIITTSSIAGNLSDRSLNAITLSHIRRSYLADTGQNLDAVLQNNSLSALVASFAAESKLLGHTLVASINASR
jgi:hypothetical protein